MSYPVQIYSQGESVREFVALVHSWLIDRQLKPERFRCATNLKGISLRLEFPVESHASLFADHFGGTLLQPIGVG